MSNVYSKLNDSIVEYVRESNNGAFVTGWVLSASLSHPMDDGADSYVTISSDGLPYHTQIGLLSVAISDANNIGLLSTMAGRLGFSFPEDDEGDEDDE
jgi:hypothetical protein